MLHDLANDESFHALKRAAEDREGWRDTEQGYQKPAVQHKIQCLCILGHHGTIEICIIIIIIIITSLPIKAYCNMSLRVILY